MRGVLEDEIIGKEIFSKAKKYKFILATFL